MRHLAFSLIATMAALLAGLESPPAHGKEPKASTLTLSYHGDLKLKAADSHKVEAMALEILRSSQFNSSAPLWQWDDAAIQKEYQLALAGDRLIVTYTPAEEVITEGGALSVKQLIVGLNGSQYASSVHTTDITGHVVGHAKYSGVLCIQLLDLVKSLPNKSLGRTHER